MLRGRAGLNVVDNPDRFSLPSFLQSVPPYFLTHMSIVLQFYSDFNRKKSRTGATDCRLKAGLPGQKPRCWVQEAIRNDTLGFVSARTTQRGGGFEADPWRASGMRRIRQDIFRRGQRGVVSQYVTRHLTGCSLSQIKATRRKVPKACI